MNAFVKSVAFTTCTIAFALCFEFALIGRFRSVSMREAFSHVEEMRRPLNAIDSMTVLFKQDDDATCGAFALAYILTLMGDDIFGEQIRSAVPPESPAGYSLAELANIATSRGFKAEGFAGGIANLPRESEPPVIAHLRMGHFVAVLMATHRTVTFFDPNTGHIHMAPSREFERIWSGKYLALGTQDYPSSFP